MRTMILGIVMFACAFVAASADTSNTPATNASEASAVSLPAVNVNSQGLVSFFDEWVAGSEYGVAVRFPGKFTDRSVGQSTFGSVTYSATSNAKKFILNIYPPVYFNRVAELYAKMGGDPSHCSSIKSDVCFPADKQGVIETSQQPVPWGGSSSMEVQTVFYRINNIVYELTTQRYPHGDPNDPDIPQFLNSLKQ